MLTELLPRQTTPATPDKTTMSFGPRRGLFINAAVRMAEEGEPLDADTVDYFDTFDLIYRTLCAVMYNYAPMSGHPGGSISSGRFVARLLFDVMDYDSRNNRYRIRLVKEDVNIKRESLKTLLEMSYKLWND